MAESTATVKDFVVSNAVKLAAMDYEKMQGIAKAIYENPALLAEFERDPEGTAHKINGFEVPEGFHLHIADENNKFYPAEDHGVFGADDKNDWSRIEVRAGYKTISLVGCAAPM